MKQRLKNLQKDVQNLLPANAPQRRKPSNLSILVFVLTIPFYSLFRHDSKEENA